MPTSSPRPIIVFWITAVETLSASARSLTVTPDGTVTGPVGATRLLALVGRVAAAAAAAALVAGVARPDARRRESITTRRRRPAVAPAPARWGREQARAAASRECPGRDAGRAPPPSRDAGAVDAVRRGAGAWPGGAGGACRRGAARGRVGVPGRAALRRADGRRRAARVPSATGTRGGAAATRCAILLRAGRLPPSARAAAASSTASPDSLTPASARRRATSAGSSPRSRAISATRFLGIEPRNLPSGCRRLPEPAERLQRSSGTVTRRRSVRVSGRARPRTDDAALEPVDPRAAAVAAPRRELAVRGRESRSSSRCGRRRPQPTQVRVRGRARVRRVGLFSRAASSRCAGMPQ